MMVKLGLVQIRDSTSTCECDQEYSHALGNLITEISLSDVQEIVDVQGEKRKIVSILKEDTGNNHPLRQKDLLREIFQLVSL